MNIREIIERMNASEVITEVEYLYWEANYDAGTMPAMNPAADYMIIDLDDFEIDDEMVEELAYDAAVFNQAMEEVEFNPEMLIPEGDGDDYSPVDDGSWYGR